MIERDLKLRAYLRSFFSDWFTGMCGPISVPFAAVAVWTTARYAKVLWGFLAAACFLTASYRVWRKERKAGNDRAEKLRQEIGKLQEQIAALRRKPYDEELERLGGELLALLSEDGKRLLCYLLQNEPLDVKRQFVKDISVDHQLQQLGIAMSMGIVRHHRVYVASGMLLRTDYEINAQYRPVLQDLLYRADTVSLVI